MFSAFGVDHGDISKALGGPKVKGQAVWSYGEKKNGERVIYEPNEVAVSANGKSLILRRPKYHMTLMPYEKNRAKSSGIHDVKNFTLNGRDKREKLHSAYMGGKRKFTLNDF